MFFLLDNVFSLAAPFLFGYLDDHIASLSDGYDVVVLSWSLLVFPAHIRRHVLKVLLNASLAKGRNAKILNGKRRLQITRFGGRVLLFALVEASLTGLLSLFHKGRLNGHLCLEVISLIELVLSYYLQDLLKVRPHLGINAQTRLEQVSQLVILYLGLTERLEVHVFVGLQVEDVGLGL